MCRTRAVSHLINSKIFARVPQGTADIHKHACDGVTHAFLNPKTRLSVTLVAHSKDDNVANETKTELAADRTDMAEDRTLLANERTFAGWMRTGLSSVGIALGFHALFNAMSPSWIPRLISTVFLMLAILIFWAAERRAAQVCQRLDAHLVETLGGANMRLISTVLTIATIALIAALWLLRTSGN